MSSHSIYQGSEGWGDSCSCGLRFSANEPWAALDHALPLTIASMREDILADPNSDPALIARVEDLQARANGK